MGAYSKIEKLLMHFSQESLTGAPVTWYTNLEPSRVHSWKDLMVAFVRQYQYNSNMAPDRMQLQNMCKEEHKSFKEYAQRWKNLASEVAPSMMEREMITMIVDTLQVFYYEKMVGYMPSSFADFVFADKRIEVDLRRGNFDYPTLMNRKPTTNGENKEGGKNPCCDCRSYMAKFPTSSTISILNQYQPFSLPTTLSTENTQSSTKATPKLATKPAFRASDTKHHP